MATYTLIATKATRMEDTSPTTNFSSQNSIHAGEYNAGAIIDRSLIQFDLSSIPAGAIISSATLKLYKTTDDSSNNTRTLRIYRLLRSWVEAQATWNKADSGTNWGTAGCANTTTDREATDIGSVSMPDPPVAGYKSITLTVSAIQAMITGGGFTNNGFLMKMDTETDDYNVFSDQTVSGQEPTLVIETLDSGAFLPIIAMM